MWKFIGKIIADASGDIIPHIDIWDFYPCIFILSLTRTYALTDLRTYTHSFTLTHTHSYNSYASSTW